MLCFGQKEEGADRLADAKTQIAGIFRDADNFVLARPSQFQPAEMLSDRVFVPEEPPRKRFIDHRHVLRSRSILLQDAPSPNDGISDRLKVSCSNPIP